MSNITKYILQFLVVLLSLSLWSGSAVAAGEVKLLKVNSIFSSYRGAWLRGNFEVIVSNLGYVKQVHIHYRKTTGAWGDFPLSYNRPAGAGKEVWSASFNNTGGGSDLPNVAEPIEFAVKYQVNGAIYWDNNNGSNYRILQNGGTILVGRNVYNAIYSPSVSSTNMIYGYVTVKNLAFAKTVEVNYSTDNWATVNVATATYSPSFWSGAYSSAPNPNSYGFEEWNYGIPVGNTATRVDYVFKYVVNGMTYWDNNFGNNYVSTIAR